jgi:starch-binding outer membrane protein, SusD/RagB family
MKRIYFLSLLAVILTILPGCEDYLDTTSKSSQAVDITFESVSDANLALLGAYALMNEDAMYSSRISLFWMTNTDIEVTSFGAADYGNADRRGLSNFMSRPTMDMSDITRGWNTLYQAIERLNLVIANVPKSSITIGDSDEAKLMWNYYAEALTLRAMFYTELCRNFGDVPFRTEPASEATFYVERTDRDKIYEQLILDLNEAEQYLTYVGRGQYSTVERVTKGFAKGLKARIALYRAGYSVRADGVTRQGDDANLYYEIARKETSELISEGVHTLNPNFQDHFIMQCRNQVDNNFRESLFEVGFGVGRSGEVGYSNGTRFSGTPSAYAGRGTQGYVNTSPVFFYSFDEEDTRRNSTVDIFVYDNEVAATNGGPAGYRQKISSNPKDYRIGKWSIKWLTGAALSGSIGTDQKYFNGINWTIMRMSDVYLMHAEAEYRLNGATADAKESLKVVRRRAFPAAQHAVKVDQYVDALNGDAFFNAIVDERAWELAGEGVRKYDLVRWNLLGEYLQRYKTENAELAVNGILPVRLGKSYSVPARLYYKFSTDDIYPEIDYSSANFTYTLTESPGDDYYYVAWFPISETNQTSYINEWLPLLNKGYDKGVNNHLFALPSEVVGTSGGLWENDPYWKGLN